MPTPAAPLKLGSSGEGSLPFSLRSDAHYRSTPERTSSAKCQRQQCPESHHPSGQAGPRPRSIRGGPSGWSVRARGGGAIPRPDPGTLARSGAQTLGHASPKGPASRRRAICWARRGEGPVAGQGSGQSGIWALTCGRSPGDYKLGGRGHVAEAGERDQGHPRGSFMFSRRPAPHPEHQSRLRPGPGRRVWGGGEGDCCRGNPAPPRPARWGRALGGAPGASCSVSPLGRKITDAAGTCQGHQRPRVGTARALDAPERRHLQEGPRLSGMPRPPALNRSHPGVLGKGSSGRLASEPEVESWLPRRLEPSPGLRVLPGKRRNEV